MRLMLMIVWHHPCRSTTVCIINFTLVCCFWNFICTRTHTQTHMQRPKSIFTINPEWIKTNIYIYIDKYSKYTHTHTQALYSVLKLSIYTLSGERKSEQHTKTVATTLQRALSQYAMNFQIKFGIVGSVGVRIRLHVCMKEQTKSHNVAVIGDGGAAAALILFYFFFSLFFLFCVLIIHCVYNVHVLFDWLTVTWITCICIDMYVWYIPYTFQCACEHAEI